MSSIPRITPPRFPPPTRRVSVGVLTASRLSGPEASLSSNCGRGHQPFPAIDGACLSRTVGALSPAHGQGVRPNLVGLLTDYSGASTRVRMSTLGPRVCSGTFRARRSSSFIETGSLLSLRTEASGHFIDGPIGQWAFYRGGEGRRCRHARCRLKRCAHGRYNAARRLIGGQF